MLLFAMVAFTACKKDDKPDERLIGKWEMDSASSIVSGWEEEYTIDPDKRPSMTFNADGSVVISGGSSLGLGSGDLTNLPKYTLSSNAQSLT